MRELGGGIGYMDVPDDETAFALAFGVEPVAQLEELDVIAQ